MTGALCYPRAGVLGDCPLPVCGGESRQTQHPLWGPRLHGGYIAEQGFKHQAGRFQSPSFGFRSLKQIVTGDGPMGKLRKADL